MAVKQDYITTEIKVWNSLKKNKHWNVRTSGSGCLKQLSQKPTTAQLP